MDNFAFQLSKKLEQMAYPAELEVTSLVEQGRGGGEERPKTITAIDGSQEGVSSERMSAAGDAGGTADPSDSAGGDAAGSGPPSTTLPTIILAPEGKEPYIRDEGPLVIQERVHKMVEAFHRRSERIKQSIAEPSSPDSLTDDEEDSVKTIDMKKRLDSLVPDMSSRPDTAWLQLVGVQGTRAKMKRTWLRLKRLLTPSPAIEPTSRVYITWLVIVSVCYIYNAITIPLRVVFSQYQTESNLQAWMICDYLADAIYLLDILLFNFRVKFIDNGFWVGEPQLIRRHYAKGTRFKIDLLSLAPLDLLYLKYGHLTILRSPRLLKIHVFWECFNRLDSVLSSPHVVRLTRTVLYMLYMIHLNCCAYYAMSKLQGIASNSWVFSGVGHSYIRCFYFATKTVTSIGKNPRPQNDKEHVFMTISWLLGVFIFALLIGQIRDIMATATRASTEYRAVMDSTQDYMHQLNLPTSLQDKIKLWFTYTWQSQKTLNENNALEYLPKKMRTDVALSVHIHTLAKVQLFQDCDKGLLRDLVLKLQPVIYLPGDYVCTKGEVGKEMYIIQSGEVQVVGGPENSTVFATLGEGSVFGEVSLLAVGGGNRRTADVRSRGFSNLFVLSKADLQEAIRDYPEAQEVLRKKARKLLKQTMGQVKRKPSPEEDIIFQERQETPKLMRAVLQVVPHHSYTASVIRRASRSLSSSAADNLQGAGPAGCPLHSQAEAPPPAVDATTLEGAADGDKDVCLNDLETQQQPTSNRTGTGRCTPSSPSHLSVTCVGCTETSHTTLPPNVPRVTLENNKSKYDLKELGSDGPQDTSLDSGTSRAEEDKLMLQDVQVGSHLSETNVGGSSIQPESSVGTLGEEFEGGVRRRGSGRRPSALEIETIQEVTEKLYSQFIQQVARNLNDEEREAWTKAVMSEAEEDSNDSIEENDAGGRIVDSEYEGNAQTTVMHLFGEGEPEKTKKAKNSEISLSVKQLEHAETKEQTKLINTSAMKSSFRRIKSRKASKKENGVRFAKDSKEEKVDISEESEHNYPLDDMHLSPFFATPSSQRWNSRRSVPSLDQHILDSNGNETCLPRKPSFSTIVLPLIKPRTYQDYGFSEKHTSVRSEEGSASEVKDSKPKHSTMNKKALAQTDNAPANGHSNSLAADSQVKGDIKYPTRASPSVVICSSDHVNHVAPTIVSQSKPHNTHPTEGTRCPHYRSGQYCNCQQLSGSARSSKRKKKKEPHEFHAQGFSDRYLKDFAKVVIDEDVSNCWNTTGGNGEDVPEKNGEANSVDQFARTSPMGKKETHVDICTPWPSKFSRSLPYRYKYPANVSSQPGTQYIVNQDPSVPDQVRHLSLPESYRVGVGHHRIGVSTSVAKDSLFYFQRHRTSSLRGSKDKKHDVQPMCCHDIVPSEKEDTML